MSRSGRDLFEPKLGLTLPLCGLHFVFFFLIQADPQKSYALFSFSPLTAFVQPWTFFTYQFLHTGLLDLFFNTMLLYVLGMALEQEWGTGEFTAFWLVSTLGASGSAWLLGQPLASGSLILNVSMLFAYAFLFPETQFYIYFILPVKVKWMAWFGAALLAYRFVKAIPVRGLSGGLVELAGATAGFAFFWFRHHGRFRVRKAGRAAVAAVKSAGLLREDAALSKRNSELFPKVEALRTASRSGDLPPEMKAFAAELAALVVPGVNICKPYDFKGDKDGICLRCEGFAECSLRYVAGQPGEIVVRQESG